MIQMSMSPLPNGALRDRIEYLTSSVGFPLDRIFVYEGTYTTLYHLNNYYMLAYTQMLQKSTKTRFHRSSCTF